MVNAQNVKSLLLRLHQETQPGATATSGTSALPSFASSLGSAIVAAAGDGQSDNGLMPMMKNAEGGTATSSVSQEKGSGAVVGDVPVSAQQPEVSSVLEVGVAPRVAVKSLTRSEPPISEGLEGKDVSLVVSADEEGKPIGKPDKAKTQKADGRESESKSLSAVASTVPSPVSAEAVASQQAIVTAPGDATAPTPEKDQSQLLPDARNSTNTTTAKVTTAQRAQVRPQRLPPEQKTARSTKGDPLASSEKHEDVSESSSSSPDSQAFPRQLVKQTLEHGGVVQATAQSANPQTGLQANHVPASQVSTALTTVHAVKSAAVLVTSTQSSDVVSPGADAGVRFQAGMGLSGTGERMIAATSSSLEVGLSHETHGWLKIRAEMTDAGTVAATLSSTSATGEQMLHRELPAISSFLNGEQLTSTSLVVHSSSEIAGQFAGMDGGGGSGGQARNGSNGSQGNSRGDSTTASDAGLSLEEGFEGLHDDWGRTGSAWLSVRA